MPSPLQSKPASSPGAAAGACRRRAGGLWLASSSWLRQAFSTRSGLSHSMPESVIDDDDARIADGEAPGEIDRHARGRLVRAARHAGRGGRDERVEVPLRRR